MKENLKPISRREFVRSCSQALPAGLFFFTFGIESLAAGEEGSQYDPTQHNYGMGIDIHKCIGCGRCAEACKGENNVPREPIYFRTWVERYVISTDGEAQVDSPNGGIDGFPETREERDIVRTFFVPKLCNHCANAPCVQVCPVGATFTSRDGVVLVDEKYCIGCRYCIQACPYGARFLHPEKRVAEKCTFCYHRIVEGLVPACVEVCPTQARVFGDVGLQSSPLRRFVRFHDITVLKPQLNTKPKVYYAGADGEVR
ncbi:MAG TPA: 4Fe-4S dicluster domain-containing protein [Candidatus Deferrimicrobium sp.]|nr:4Fe-4S dicluster domain-containing protein [Candidatus Deferrimicrobium sp.]